MIRSVCATLLVCLIALLGIDRSITVAFERSRSREASDQLAENRSLTTPATTVTSRAILRAVLLLCGPASPANEPADAKAADTTVADATGAVPAPGVAAEEIPLAAPVDDFVGARSCSATACHGAVQPDRGGVNHNGNPLAASNAAGILRNEFLTWLEEDPHSGAAATLSGERSQRILRNLGAMSEAGELTALMDHHIKNCVACHAPRTSAAPAKPADIRELAASDGVTCESCHGAAAGWIDEHYSRRWATYDADKKSAAGMIDTANLLRRAEACAKCHVGAPGMEVNHDLIAAGHPPLKFEFTAYLDLLPKHWNEAKERAEITDFESRSWLAGQIASTRAALELLQWRSDPAERSGPAGPVWPELAELDCYACHHDLQSPSGRIARGFGGKTPGRPRWGSWYFSMPRHLAGDHAFAAATSQLADAMSHSVSSQNRERIHQQTTAARQAFSQWLDTSGLRTMLARNTNRLPADRRAELWNAASAALARQDGAAAVENWETAVQAYLLLVALDREDASSSTDALRQIRADLAFEPVSDAHAATVFNSPKRFSTNRDQLRKALLEVLKKTRQAGQF